MADIHDTHRRLDEIERRFAAFGAEPTADEVIAAMATGRPTARHLDAAFERVHEPLRAAVLQRAAARRSLERHGEPGDIWPDEASAWLSYDTTAEIPDDVRSRASALLRDPAAADGAPPATPWWLTARQGLIRRLLRRDAERLRREAAEIAELPFPGWAPPILSETAAARAVQIVSELEVLPFPPLLLWQSEDGLRICTSQDVEGKRMPVSAPCGGHAGVGAIIPLLKPRPRAQCAGDARSAP